MVTIALTLVILYFGTINCMEARKRKTLYKLQFFDTEEIQKLEIWHCNNVYEIKPLKFQNRPNLKELNEQKYSKNILN